MDKNGQTKDKKEEIKKDDSKAQEEEKKNKEAEELKKRVEELENNWKRAVADYQNLEKRVQEERKEWILKANKDLLLHLLPVLDTLILAKKHIQSQDQGLSLSITQFLDILKTEGVERIETVNKSFDPSLMECVEAQQGEEGKVLKEHRVGYRLHDKVLRPAQVTVGKKKIDKEEEEKAKKELQKGNYM